MAILQPRAREEARVGVNRCVGPVKVKRRRLIRQRQIGLVKRANGADVFPIAVKGMGKNADLVDRTRNDVLAEIVLVAAHQQANQDLGFKHVDAHRGQIAILRIGCWQPQSI